MANTLGWHTQKPSETEKNFLHDCSNRGLVSLIPRLSMWEGSMGTEPGNETKV